MYEKVADGMSCSYEELPTKGFSYKCAASSEIEGWAKVLELELEEVAVDKVMAVVAEKDFPAEAGATLSWEQRVKVCCAMVQEQCVDETKTCRVMYHGVTCAITCAITYAITMK